MEKSWLAPDELVGIAGLPKSRQGVNRRAREEGWEKRRRKGVQGRAVEYAFDSLPQMVRQRLQLKEMSAPHYVTDSVSPKLLDQLSSSLPPSQLLILWIQLFHNLTEQDQTALIDYVLHEGVMAMLSRLEVDQDTREDDEHPTTA